MRIVIDIQGMQTPQSKGRGVGRYVTEIVKEFIKISHHHEVILVANDNFNDTLESLKDVLGDAKIVFWSYSEDNLRSAQRDREKFILKLRPDIVWMPNLQEGLDDATVTSINRTVNSSCIWVTTLHDIIPIIFQKEYLKIPRITNWYNEKIEQTRKSDYLFTVSEFSRDRISELLPFDKSKIFVIPPAVNREMFDFSDDAVREKAPYILLVSGYNQHKNVESLIKAYSMLSEDIQKNYKLLLIGKNLFEPLENFIINNNFQNLNLEFLEDVSDVELINYYKRSSLFVFPSYAEGFGIPPLEAMACGVPTITSNAHSLPEVTGMAEAMFNPFDVQDMANMIHRGLTDTEFQKKLIDNGLERANHFCWKKSSKYMLECFEEINMNHKYKEKNVPKILL